MAWHWVLATSTGTPIAELTYARNRKIQQVLNVADNASWTMDGRNPQAADIIELATDLLIYWDDTLIFRGRVGSTDDTIDTDRHDVNFAAVAYEGLLARRIAKSDQVFTATAQGAIGWALVAYAQDNTDWAGGNLGITAGTDASPTTTRDYTAAAGTKISEALDTLAHVWGGYEWWITPDLVFQRASQRSVTQDLPLAYPTTCSKVTRQVDTSTYANLVRASGTAATSTDPVPSDIQAVTDLATRPEGRWEFQFGATDVKDATAIGTTAQWQLARLGTINPAYTFTLKPGIWAPNLAAPGDMMTFHVASGRLDAGGTERIAQLDIDIDDQGIETVQVTLGQRRTDLDQVLVSIPDRLERLERR